MTEGITEIIISHAELRLRHDSIIQLDLQNHSYTIEDIGEINWAIGELGAKKRVPLLVMAAEYSIVDNEARKFMSKPEAAPYSLAEAYVIKSLPQRILANFFINVTGPPVPTRFFTGLAPAITWLKQQGARK